MKERILPMHTYFFSLTRHGTPPLVTMYASEVHSGQAKFQSDARDWEQHKFHLLNTAGVDMDVLERAERELETIGHARINEVLLHEGQLAQLGLSAIHKP